VNFTQTNNKPFLPPLNLPKSKTTHLYLNGSADGKPIPIYTPSTIDSGELKFSNYSALLLIFTFKIY